MINQPIIHPDALDTLERMIARIRRTALSTATDAIANREDYPSQYGTPWGMITYAVDALIDDAIDAPEDALLPATLQIDLRNLLARIAEHPMRPIS